MNARNWARTLWLSALLSLFVAHSASAATDNGTLTVGITGIPCGFPMVIYTGYLNGAFGSYSPTGLTGGKTVNIVMDRNDTCTFFNYSQLTVTGFSSDPGTAWLTSTTCNGVTKLRTSATYSYNSGSATWTWTTLFGFVTLVNTNVACTIVHT